MTHGKKHPLQARTSVLLDAEVGSIAKARSPEQQTFDRLTTQANVIHAGVCQQFTAHRIFTTSSLLSRDDRYTAKTVSSCAGHGRQHSLHICRLKFTVTSSKGSAGSPGKHRGEHRGEHRQDFVSPAMHDGEVYASVALGCLPRRTKALPPAGKASACPPCVSLNHRHPYPVVKTRQPVLNADVLRKRPTTQLVNQSSGNQ